MKKEKNTGKGTKDNKEGNENVTELFENKANVSTGTQTLFNAQKFFVKKIEFAVLMDASSRLTQTPSQNKPELNINVSLNNIPLEDDRYEVDLLIKTEATQDSQPIFSGSVEEAGIFTLKNFKPEERDFILKGYCPTLLFPYAKENISNLMMRSGYVPIELPVIDFIGLYQKSIKDQPESNATK